MFKDGCRRTCFLTIILVQCPLEVYLSKLVIDLINLTGSPRSMKSAAVHLVVRLRNPSEAQSFIIEPYRPPQTLNGQE